MPSVSSIHATPTDKTPGWKLGPRRFLPAAYTVSVTSYAWVTPDGEAIWNNGQPHWVTDDELVEFSDNPRAGGLVTLTPWLELDVETSPTQPPRCVALRAPWGIATPEQRAPIAGIVAEASVLVASEDGSYRDIPWGIEWEDIRWEAHRSRGRKRTRRAITPDRLEEVSAIARANPRKPTAAVEHHFGFSRGYARRLIKLAEAAEAES